MATKDFRASQLEVSKIIASGGMTGNGLIAKNNLGLAIYSGSGQSNRAGGITRNIFSNVGADVFMFVSGSLSKKGTRRQEVSLFGGDVVISGTLYAERQVIEVDSVADGDFYVSGNVYFEPDTNSTTSVAFRQADGTNIFTVDSTNKRVGIGDDTPGGVLEIQGGTSAGVPTLMIDHRDTDQIAVDINALNITNNVIDVSADGVTTANIINISGDALTSGKGIKVESTSNNLNAAVLLDVNATGTSTNAYTVAKITKDAANLSDSNAIIGLDIDFDGTAGTAGRALRIDSEQTTGIVAEINGDGVTTGTVIDVSSDARTTGTALNISDSATNDSAGSLVKIEQAGSRAGSAASIGLDIDFNTVANANARALRIDSEQSTGIVAEINGDGITTGKVIDISADSLTTGNALYIDDNSSSVSARNTVEIIQNNVTARATTALKIQSDGGNTGILVDKNYTHGSATTIKGFEIDLDKTTATTTNNEIKGIYLDVTNTTPTNGINRLKGIEIRTTMTHAANAGTPEVIGVESFATGGSNGASTAIAFSGSTAGADVQVGLQLDVASSGKGIKLLDTTNNNNYGSIHAANNGETTIATVHAAGAAGNLILDPDGDVHMRSATGLHLTSSAGTFITRAASNYHVKSNGNIDFQVDADANGDGVFSISNGGGSFVMKYLESTGFTFNSNRIGTQDFAVAGDNDYASIFVDAGEDAIALGWDADSTPAWSELTETGTDVKLLLSGNTGNWGSSSKRGTTLIAGDLALSGSGFIARKQRLRFGTTNESIRGDGQDLEINSGRSLLLNVTNLVKLVLTGTSGTAILSSSVHNNDIAFHGNSEKEVFRIDSSENSLLMATSKKLQFRDTGLFINSPANGALSISADGTAVGIALTGSGGGIALKSTKDNAASIHLSGFGMTFDGGDQNDSFLFNNSAIQLEQISAPTSTTNKLYNVGGNLTWNGTTLGGGGTLDQAYDSGGSGLGRSITTDTGPVALWDSRSGFFNPVVTMTLAVTGNAAFGSQTLLLPGTDSHFFVSGAINHKMPGKNGITTFGGDMVVSGTLFKVESTGAVAVEVGDPGVVLSPNKVIEFGNPNEKIFGDGSHLYISSSDDMFLVATDKITLDTKGGKLILNKNTTEWFNIANDSHDAVLQPKVANKDIVMKTQAGNEAIRIDSSAEQVIMTMGAYASPGTNASFVVSGTLDGVNRGKGTAVFGGDVFISGSLYAEGDLNTKQTIVQRLGWAGSIANEDPRFPAFNANGTSVNPDIEGFWTVVGSGSLKALDLWVSEGSTARACVALFANDDDTPRCHISGSFVNNNILGDGNRGHLYIDFVKFKDYVTGSNTFNPGDLISIGVGKLSGGTFSTLAGTLYYEMDVADIGNNLTSGFPS